MPGATATSISPSVSIGLKSLLLLRARLKGYPYQGEFTSGLSVHLHPWIQCMWGSGRDKHAGCLCYMARPFSSLDRVPKITQRLSFLGFPLK